MSISKLKEKEATNLTKFYKDLPPKTCVDCGLEIKEQHESYMTKCERCLSKEEE